MMTFMLTNDICLLLKAVNSSYLRDTKAIADIGRVYVDIEVRCFLMRSFIYSKSHIVERGFYLI